MNDYKKVYISKQKSNNNKIIKYIKISEITHKMSQILTVHNSLYAIKI